LPVYREAYDYRIPWSNFWYTKDTPSSPPWRTVSHTTSQLKSYKTACDKESNGANGDKLPASVVVWDLNSKEAYNAYHCGV